MYVWIWRKLPGNLAAKLGGSLALLLVALAVLFFLVFPFAEPRLPFNNVNVDQPAPATSTIISPSLTPHA
ncbi:MAG: hypothetical protein QOF82_804 [Frankiales bacterium]|jgi:hypothetical protein|nr:hypothetical protein [Frankiales bacterium]MDX6211717.1 hypothetical protein [Frankiales bacterium]